MGGKSYYCDYCCCFLKNDVNVRKTHNSGLSHNISKTRYMRRFEDPRKVLEEECNKEPCHRYLSGRYCKFDLLCKSTHFSINQMQRLRKIAERAEGVRRRKTLTNEKKDADKKVILPWQSNSDRVKRKRSRQEIKRLPESLQPINLNRLNNDCINIEWG